MKILYATRKGEPEYMEQLITEVEARIPEAQKWAAENGFDRFRIADHTPGEAPDFTKVLNPL